MKTWDGLNAEEIASIPRDEYCFQKIERILRERNELRELSDEEIKAIANNLTCTPDKNWNVLFAREILKKASEK